MFRWHHKERRSGNRRNYKGDHPMKKIMSLMLGLSLIMGAVTFASAQEKKDDTKKEKKKKEVR